MGSEEFNENSIDSKLSQIITQQKADGEAIRKAVTMMEDQGKRISHLEQYKYWLMGAVAVGAVCLDSVKDFLTGKHQ